MKRLRRKMRERGAEGLVHGNRGKRAWNKTRSDRVEKVISLARGRYQGLNDTHLTEKLKEKEKINVIAVHGAAGVARGWDRRGEAPGSAKPRRERCCCGMAVPTAGPAKSSPSQVSWR
jgi:hypothetical protein